MGKLIPVISNTDSLLSVVMPLIRGVGVHLSSGIQSVSRASRRASRTRRRLTDRGFLARPPAENDDREVNPLAMASSPSDFMLEHLVTSKLFSSGNLLESV